MKQTEEDKNEDAKSYYQQMHERFSELISILDLNIELISFRLTTVAIKEGWYCIFISFVRHRSAGLYCHHRSNERMLNRKSIQIKMEL